VNTATHAFQTTFRYGGYGQVVRAVAKGESGWVFAVPVTDDVAPGYSKDIKKPMDLGTVAKNLKSGAYVTLGVFVSKVIDTACLRVQKHE